MGGAGRVYNTAHNVFVGQIYLGGVVGLLLLVTPILLMAFKSIVIKHSVALSLVVFSVCVMGGQYTYLLDHPNEVWINILLPLVLAYSLIHFDLSRRASP